MSIVLIDNCIKVFDCKIELDSYERDSYQREFNGLDGVVSIDLGKRTRGISVKGKLICSSLGALARQVKEMEALIDGKVHSIETGDGSSYDDLEVKTVKNTKVICGGTGVSGLVEIELIQLV